VTTHLLIDADLMAYRAAAGTQDTHDWGDGVVSVETDIEAAKRQLRDQIDRWMADLEGDRFTICLSDDFNNFRKGIDPTYKQDRATVERPETLYPLKSWLADRFPHVRRRTLEADDVMGILATEPHQETRIIVSQDKDMRTIPGLLYRPFDEKPELEDITVAEADHYHLYQTLTGDTVDCYPGCPGVGPKTADTALRTLTGVAPVHREITRGKNKGKIHTTWEATPYDTTWEVVTSFFVKKGLTERHALVQARLARILRHEDFDGHRPILWTPK
jgi:DNA polymerase-1